MHNSKRFPPTRRAFTLIELLVAISIIALLVAMLLPAIGAVRRNVQIGNIRVEIKGLETALIKFKADYGNSPPSYINFTRTSGSLPARTQAILRGIWPNMNLGHTSVTDFDGQILNGEDCLVFFLGGIRDGDAPTGFSTNPATPFVTGGNRKGPIFEFVNDRLDKTGTLYFPGYSDPYPGSKSAYVYLSSYEGRGYGHLGSDDSSLTEGYYVDSAKTVPYKQISFQIISSGPDREHGTGGHYDADDPNTSLSGRDNERDNITNFAASGGTLASY
jgi:prepilin-type N-terminal cleavage/methylation domain-containing protein